MERILLESEIASLKDLRFVSSGSSGLAKASVSVIASGRKDSRELAFELDELELKNRWKSSVLRACRWLREYLWW